MATRLNKTNVPESDNLSQQDFIKMAEKRGIAGDISILVGVQIPPSPL